ncbi:MAG TPA: glycosyltransferase family 2 protein [Clostridiales bacterium]|nr:glycosyltransferase family 2 protein [Clostridiales bacterium]HRT82016.1 glycosyltransferase family 2 protein [Oscillospiraceae bacterium]
MTEPTLSIIVPVYNVEAYLPACLDSLLNQDFENFEIILVNDGSTDSSGKICEEYAKKHKNVRLINQENRGLSAARNAGLDEALGACLAFVDSDDFVSPAMYKDLYKTLCEKGADLAICAYQKVDEAGLPLENPRGFSPCELTGQKAMENLFTPDYVYFTIACNKIFRRPLFEDLRFPQGKIFEDGYAAFRYYHKSQKVACTDNVGYFYRDRKNSISKNAQGLLSLDATDANFDAFRFLNDNFYPDLAQKALAKYTACVFEKLRSSYSDAPEIKSRFSIIRRDFKKLLPKILMSKNLVVKEKVLALTFALSPKLCKKIMTLRNL